MSLSTLELQCQTLEKASYREDQTPETLVNASYRVYTTTLYVDLWTDAKLTQALAVFNGLGQRSVFGAPAAS